MIAHSPALHRALLDDTVELRPRATWDLAEAGAPGDKSGENITDRVIEWGVTAQRVPPFLGDAQTSDHSIIIDNSDGRFTTRSMDGEIPLGPDSYYMTALRIEQDVRLRDGTIETLPVYEGLVQYIVPIEGTVEIKTAGRLAVCQQFPAPEEIALEPMASGRDTTAADHLDQILAYMPSIISGRVGTDTETEQALNALSESGWTLSGGIADGSNLGLAIRELARCCLSSAIDGENGDIRFIPQVLPRNFGQYLRAGIDVPETMQEPLCFGYQLDEGVQTAVSEVYVMYAAGMPAKYREVSAETRMGRRTTPTISMEYARLGWMGKWSARLIYEFNKEFPLSVSFVAPAIGLVVQIGDLVYVKDTITNVKRQAVVVGKAWRNPGMVTLVVRTQAAHGGIFDTTYSVWGSSTWGGDVL